MLVKANLDNPLGPAEKIALGNDKFALVSPEDHDWINRHKWYAKKSFYRFYACRKTRQNGFDIIVRMHRKIAQTPSDMVCHHQNHNSLDNRRANLLNMTYYDHKIFHSYR